MYLDYRQQKKNPERLSLIYTSQEYYKATGLALPLVFLTLLCLYTAV